MIRKVSDRSLSCRLPHAGVGVGRLSVLLALVASFAWFSSGAKLGAAEPPDPDVLKTQFDMEIRPEKAEYAPGETVKVFSGVVARVAGVQGWSYGVKHEDSVLELLSVTTDGTDVPGVFSQGFNQTTKEKIAGGWIQAVVLSFLSPAEIPVSSFFSMAAAEYKVVEGACSPGAPATAKIEFTEELAVPNSPPVEINLTVGGVGFVPEKIVDAEISVKCADDDGKLYLKFDKTDTDLVADQTEEYQLKVLFENTSASAGYDVQGWSYGITLDTAELVTIAGAPGADSQALRGNQGPEFKVYNLDERNLAGTLRGITVGAVVATTPPATAVLSVPAGARKFIDTIRLKSAQTIPQGGASRTTVIGFSDGLGVVGNQARPVEVIATVGGVSVIPDFTDTLTLTLLGGGVSGPRFIRGDANNDARVDISDGVWVINALFYGGPATVCKAAADANADSKQDLSDAMYIFQYQLQPGATPGNLFPKPPAPFPNCGTAAGVTEADCPVGSTTCS